MLTPTWETAPGALAALLNGASNKQLVMADVYTVDLLGGQQLRYTSADAQVVAGGIAWRAGPILSRGQATLSVGISVDSMQVTVSAPPTDTVNGVPLIAFIARGGLANAHLMIERVFAAADGVPVGRLPVFSGRVADITGGRTTKQLQVQSDTALLDVMVPLDLYQAACKNTLYDPACGVDRAARRVAGSATAGTGALRMSFAHQLPQTAGYFDLGVVTFTAGPNAGVARNVRQHTANTLVTLQPWPFTVSAGDAFTAVPGCNKTQATCSGKFANLSRFRAEPYIPAPETVV